MGLLSSEAAAGGEQGFHAAGMQPHASACGSPLCMPEHGCDTMHVQRMTATAAPAGCAGTNPSSLHHHVTCFVKAHSMHVESAAGSPELPPASTSLYRQH